MTKWIHCIINVAWKQGKLPDEWGNAIICPVYKKRDKPSVETNYRGISLLPQITKICKKNFRAKIRSCLEKNTE